MPKRTTKKNPFQLELNFRLSTGSVKAKATQLQFDFYNVENNFFGQLYRNRSKLTIDILRLSLADKVFKSRTPTKKMLLFKSEATRRKVTSEKRAVLNRYGIETATIIVRQGQSTL